MNEEKFDPHAMFDDASFDLVSKKMKPSEEDKPAKKKLSGRPKGAKTKPVAEVVTSRCPKCGSSDRKPYKRSTNIAHRGMKDGRPYNRVVKRPTCCSKCGQARTDHYFEFI